MFVLTLIADSIRIPPPLLSQPTLTSVQTEIEKRYPNKIIIDVGLILCPYGPPLEIGDGVLVPGDGGAHHQVLFQCVVFRPFVEEVLVGTVRECNEEGLSVSIGEFFDQVFIPAYWMLNPSHYDANAGVWVWTPSYDDDEMEEEQKGNGVKIKEENDGNNTNGENHVGEQDVATENRFEIEIGAEIRFKVKSVNFTRITTTMKGVQATTTTTTSSSSGYGYQGAPPATASMAENGNNNDETVTDGVEVRRRSSSADLSDSANHPAPMQIVGSICEDGLGLLSWWTAGEEGEGGGGENGKQEEDYIEDDGDP